MLTHRRSPESQLGLLGTWHALSAALPLVGHTSNDVINPTTHPLPPLGCFYVFYFDQWPPLNTADRWRCNIMNCIFDAVNGLKRRDFFWRVLRRIFWGSNSTALTWWKPRNDHNSANNQRWRGGRRNWRCLRPWVNSDYEAVKERPPFSSPLTSKRHLCFNSHVITTLPPPPSPPSPPLHLRVFKANSVKLITDEFTQPLNRFKFETISAVICTGFQQIPADSGRFWRILADFRLHSTGNCR